MKKLLPLFLALLLMGCSSSAPIDNQFFGCTLGESSEMDVIAAMEGYEIDHYRQGLEDDNQGFWAYNNVPFAGAVWERASFVIENDTLRGMVFADERRLPFAMYVERFHKKYSRYCKTSGKDSIDEWYDYSDGKTQIELSYSDLWPGTMLFYRDSSSKSWQE